MMRSDLIVRSLVAMGAALTLAACGGDIMSSYTGERDRVRGTVSSNVVCTEQAGPMFQCKSEDGLFEAWMMASAANAPPQVTILLQGNMLTAGQAGQDFVKVIGLYGMSEDELKQCVAEGRFREQAATHVLLCQTAGGNGFAVSVSYSKRI